LRPIASWTFLREVERGKLQQPHGVLQAGRDRVLLLLGRAQGGKVHGRVSFDSSLRARRLPARRVWMASLTQPSCHRCEGAAAARRFSSWIAVSTQAKRGRRVARAPGHRLRQLLPE
jgi:hypothetical protein